MKQKLLVALLAVTANAAMASGYSVPFQPQDGKDFYSMKAGPTTASLSWTRLSPGDKHMPDEAFFADLPPIGYTVNSAIYEDRSLPTGGPRAKVAGIPYPVCEAALQHGQDAHYWNVPFKGSAVNHVSVRTGGGAAWLRTGKALSEQMSEAGYSRSPDNLDEPAGSMVRWEHVDGKRMLRTVVGYAFRTVNDSMVGGKVSRVHCVLIDSHLEMADGSHLRKAVAYVAAGADRTCAWAADRDPQVKDAVKRADKRDGDSSLLRMVKGVINMPSIGHKAGDNATGPADRSTVCAVDPEQAEGVWLLFGNPYKSAVTPVPVDTPQAKAEPDASTATAARKAVNALDLLD